MGNVVPNRLFIVRHVAAACFACALTSAAFVEVSQAQKADIEFGRYLATECLTCHRVATAGAAIPNIFGMQHQTFIALIKAYRDKQLPNPIMQGIAGRLKDDEIEALAHYFAITKKP